MKKKIILLAFLANSCFLFGCTFSAKKVITPAEPPSASPTTSPKSESESEVPLPTGEDIVRTFFELINEKRIPEVVAMLSSTAAPDESTKQTWGVNFNTLETISIKTIEEWQKSAWTENQITYKVVVVAKLKPNPQFYAWDNGENTKWINLVKENRLWKISAIASGP